LRNRHGPIKTVHAASLGFRQTLPIGNIGSQKSNAQGHAVTYALEFAEPQNYSQSWPWKSSS
jgi:hypothetical protein